MEFREIDKSNYWDCIELTIDDNQEGFVADSKQSKKLDHYRKGLLRAASRNRPFLYLKNRSFPRSGSSFRSPLHALTIPMIHNTKIPRSRISSVHENNPPLKCIIE